MGCGLALLAAAVVKTKHFRSRHMPLESSLVVLLAFASYMLADGLMLSGIVSALFCGIFMAAYAKPNMMPNSRDRVSPGGGRLGWDTGGGKMVQGWRAGVPRPADQCRSRR